MGQTTGCRFVQGYIYARPLEAAEIDTYLRGEKRFPTYRELLQPDSARDVA